MSSIWGEQHSKFVSGINTVDLNYCVVPGNFLSPVSIMHESKLTGLRTWSKNEKYLMFNVAVYLFKETNPNTKATEIEQYENQPVTFYPFADGTISGDMRIEKIDFRPLSGTENDRKDVAILTLISTQWAGSLLHQRLTDEDGIQFTDEDGKVFTND